MKKAGLAFELTGLILSFFILGAVADHLFGGEYFQAIGVLLAFVLWIFMVWKRLRS